MEPCSCDNKNCGCEDLKPTQTKPDSSQSQSFTKRIDIVKESTKPSVSLGNSLFTK